MNTILHSSGDVRPAVGSAREDQDRLRSHVWPELRKVARPHAVLGFDFDNFIADFEGSRRCADRLAELPAYEAASAVFVTPDDSTDHIRRRTLEDGKVLVVSTFGITDGFRLIDPTDLPEGGPEQASNLTWIHDVAPLVSLSSLSGIGISLLVTGAGAVVDGGIRLGKGHGYFDLEWAMLSEIGALAEEPTVVGVVHDCQRLAVDVMTADHDVPLDSVVTPSGVEHFDVSRGPGRVLWGQLAMAKAMTMPPVVELALHRAGTRWH